jgi:hypothetical protein
MHGVPQIILVNQDSRGIKVNTNIKQTILTLPHPAVLLPYRDMFFLISLDRQNDFWNLG